MYQILILLVSVFVSVNSFASDVSKSYNTRGTQIAIYVNGEKVTTLDNSHIELLQDQVNTRENYVLLANLVMRSQEIQRLGFSSKNRILDFVTTTLKKGNNVIMECRRNNESGYIEECDYSLASTGFPYRGRIPQIRSGDSIR